VNPFVYQLGELFCEAAPAEEIVRRFGTPVIAYSAAGLRANIAAVRAAFAPVDPEIRFPVQSLPSPGVLRVIAAEGCGMAAMTAGELERAWLSRAPMGKISFAGVGKTDDDIRAALDGIYSPLFQAGVTVDGRPPYYRGPAGVLIAESPDEFARISAVAASIRVNARVAISVNTAIEAPPDDPVPAADAESKFGVSCSEAIDMYRRFEHMPHITLHGLAASTGQVTHTVESYAAAIGRLVETATIIRNKGADIPMLDLGGGLPAIGVSESTSPLAEYAAAIEPLVSTVRDGWTETTMVIRPGRSITASAGVLLVGVRETRPTEDRLVVITDAGLNPADRPADIDGFRTVWPIATEPEHEPPGPGVERVDTSGLIWSDIVGPAGRDSDTIGRGRLIPKVHAGDRLAVFAAGADAMHAVQRGGDHPIPAEVLVEGRTLSPLRPRAGLVEQLAPELGPLEKL
jgi:diaminopimelate decarboxylase